MPLIRSVLTITFGLALFCAGSAQKERLRGPVIRQVDHILIDARDPGPLFKLFTETLQIPEVRPLADSGGYMSGGVGAGNVQLEIFRHSDRTASSSRIAAVAFEPYPLDKALRELEVRGVPHAAPEPYSGTLPKGVQGTLWTRVHLPSFSRAATSFYLYEYSPQFLKVDVRRKQMTNRLVLRKGGPIGFESVQEIVLATTDYANDLAAWRKLLGNPDPAGRWRLGTGPSMRLVRGSSDCIQELIFKVRSLEEAKKFLTDHNLLGNASARSLTLRPARIQGLAIRLVE